MKFLDFLKELERDMVKFAPLLCAIIPGAAPFAPIAATLPAAQQEVETLFSGDKSVTSETKAKTAIALATNTANTIAQMSTGGQKHSAEEVYGVLKPLNDALIAQAKVATVSAADASGTGTQSNG